MKMWTSLGPRAGVMPPWYRETNIGIQHYKNDPSLSEEEIATIGAWADSGTPEGNPADMPAPLDWHTSAWMIREPDLITVQLDITVAATAPDRWGEIETKPVGTPRTGIWPRSRSRRSTTSTRPRAAGIRSADGSSTTI
jgi:hypothetical protein